MPMDEDIPTWSIPRARNVRSHKYTAEAPVSNTANVYFFFLCCKLTRPTVLPLVGAAVIIPTIGNVGRVEVNELCSNPRSICEMLDIFE